MEVSDDSGFLALVVPASYPSFVAEDWDFESLRAHFRGQMAQRTMLIWATGLEGFWRVEVRVGGPTVRGFREVVGPVRVAGGSVLVTSYDSLTMAAQFADVSLPQGHERNQLVSVPDGDYACRVVQMFDPETDALAGDGSPDFVIVLGKPSGAVSAWADIPWFPDAEQNTAADRGPQSS